MDYVGHYDWTECHRGEMPANTLYERDPAVLARLASMDPLAEIVYNARRENDFGADGRWSLYRVVWQGASPADDLLRHEFDLPNGASIEHVIGMMRERSIIQTGTVTGGMDVDHAKRHFAKEMFQRCSGRLRRQRLHEEFRADLLDIAEEWDTFVWRGFTSGAGQRHPGRRLKPRLRPGQVRVHVGGTGPATPGHRSRKPGVPVKVFLPE